MGDKRSHYLPMDIDLSNVHFDRIGNLKQMGMMEYWQQLNNTMKDFDRGKTELEPQKKYYSHQSPKFMDQSHYI